MRVLSAIIRPDRYEAVREALTELGVGGVTVTEVRGFGRQRGKREIYRGAEYEVMEVPKLRLDVVVPATVAEQAADAVTDAARTGKVGDGVVWLAPLQMVRRIRTGEENTDVVS
ncbi:MAG: P-II family nitrogen regulator [Neomegalonema sp.]|nr:P-II family nitrogen regulator [Neomegalonema sp.]